MKIKYIPQISFTERISYEFKDGVIKAKFVDIPTNEESYMFIGVSNLDPENQWYCTDLVQSIEIVEGETVISLLYLTDEDSQLTEEQLQPFVPEFTDFEVTEQLVELHGVTQGVVEGEVNQIITPEYMHQCINKAVERAVAETLEAVNKLIDEVMADGEA